MSYNMSYCRMENTLGALRECYDNMDDGQMSDSELIARKRLIQLCREIADNYEDIADEPIDFAAAEQRRGQQDERDAERGQWGRNV